MELLSGNEAIARGAWEAGATIGVGYPGTPSTETMEAFATFDDVYAEWCPNEKVALEVGIGASAAGARVLATMKHVGVNVAADPLFTAAYTGVGGALVLLAADDPGMHSSQNEQDSRYFALAAHVPLLEPSDSAEALEFTKQAFELSEQFDLPCMIRSTVRISHAKTKVELGQRANPDSLEYEKNADKWVMMPAFARGRRASLDIRIACVKEWTESCALNVEEIRDTHRGVICSGAAYHYVREALPDASVFKLGVAYPLCTNRITEFARKVDELYCIDEASSYLSMQVRAAGIRVSEPPMPLPACGELSPAAISKAFGAPSQDSIEAASDVPARPPALCAGCPHRLVFKELMRARCIVCGDIGCYTLGALPPLSAIDTCVDMGASISMAHGFELALPEGHKPVVSVIGDSTFAHSGVSSLMNTTYNRGAGTICILDNRTTGMTGHQGNPFNGITLQGRESCELVPEEVCRSLGISSVETVNPNDASAVRGAIRSAIAAVDELNVIVFRAPCVLLRDKFQPGKPLYVNASCTGCGSCILIGCPAISKDETLGSAIIDAGMCVGCEQCSQYCNFDAIEKLEGLA